MYIISKSVCMSSQPSAKKIASKDGRFKQKVSLCNSVTNVLVIVKQTANVEFTNF